MRGADAITKRASAIVTMTEPKFGLGTIGCRTGFGDAPALAKFIRLMPHP